jgi:hypothetical protein
MSNVKAQSSNQWQIASFKLQKLMNAKKVVIPVKTGIQTSSLRRQGTRNIRNWVPVFTGSPGFLLPQE